MQRGLDGWQAIPTFEQKTPSGPRPHERQPSVHAVHDAFGPLGKILELYRGFVLGGGDAWDAEFGKAWERSPGRRQMLQAGREPKPAMPIIANVRAANRSPAQTRHTMLPRNVIVHAVGMIIARFRGNAEERSRRCQDLDIRARRVTAESRRIGWLPLNTGIVRCASGRVCRVRDAPSIRRQRKTAKEAHDAECDGTDAERQAYPSENFGHLCPGMFSRVSRGTAVVGSCSRRALRPKESPAGSYPRGQPAKLRCPRVRRHKLLQRSIDVSETGY